MLVMLAVPAGCVFHPHETPVLTGPELEYQNAATLVKEKRYQEALAVYRGISTNSPQSPMASDAFFQTAYLLVLYDNPQKDFNQALSGFDEFLNRYPDHAKAEDARNWRIVLKTILDARKENERLTRKIEELKKLDIKHEERRGK